MGAANVGPEFTEKEYEALSELELLQHSLSEAGRIAKPAPMMEQLWRSVINSGRWKKWLQPDESPGDFHSISPERQEWLVKTGCRYIWENPEVVAVRNRLYQNIGLQGTDAAAIVESSIESAMDRYFHKFNLTGLNSLL